MAAVEVEDEAEGFTEEEAMVVDGTQDQPRVTEGDKQHKGIQCFGCKRYGHIKSQCHYKNMEANLAEDTKDNKEADEGLLFMASSEDLSEGGGDGKILQVSGIGSIALRSGCGRTNTLTNVQYVPHLTHNLLSVGQLMSTGYSVEFAEANDVGAANAAQSGEELSEI
ncbi:uncharacterized protein LOC120265117 [Dioscorea cayenensis subsp. rotundata]|uniref:Uncharacterized protein LOC120265117 n=1 Tax=Dioscorea cayennensis subsp. rotundata TaxID=55577 RepID=A0AB40BRS6_DIOCR|nr:uncharacterized protein LOC120265117 [Dioscorea cayenensis subsp. rotundata]